MVKAGAEQMATLNVNTRYLDDSVVKYAKHLTRTLPDALSSCLFLSTGSVQYDNTWVALHCREGPAVVKAQFIVCVYWFNNFVSVLTFNVMFWGTCQHISHVQYNVLQSIMVGT